MKKIKAGIAGGAGYTGGELIRLLLLHPFVDIAFVQSTSNAGNHLCDVHADLLGESDMRFVESHSTDVDVIFLCGGHDAARKFISEHELPGHIVVIDLSQDFRHASNNSFKGRTFIYGLPELNRDKIKHAKSIANPGCFATCIELALLPLAAAHKLSNDIHVTATTGSTGAGQTWSATTHFSWRDSNISVYKPFTHQHLTEITEALQSLHTAFDGKIFFVPQRGNFTRGIFCAAYLPSDLSQEELEALYREFYATHPFVAISKKELDVKQVVNTNRCFLHIQKQGDTVLITAAIDNLLKGASGQAVQNMNLIFGFDEKAGLQLKPSAF